MGFWEPLFFWIFAFGALATSLAVVVLRNPLYCALLLIADFFFFAGLYVLLSAHFMAVVQVLVYGGAIMVLFLFIIMLLNIRGQTVKPTSFQLHQALGVASGLAFFVLAASAISAVVDMEAVDDARAEYAQELEQAEEDQRVVYEVQSVIPGDPTTGLRPLYADSNEWAVERAYRERLRAWDAGTMTPADAKYRPFNPDRSYELPQSLNPYVVEPQGDDAHSQAAVVPGRKGLYGTFKPISIKLVNRFVIPFELTAILLLASIIGAVILAKRRVE